MSEASARAFVAKLQSDAQFASQVAAVLAVPDADEKTRRMAATGYDFTPIELEAALGAAGAEELSDEDLDQVGGGSRNLADMIRVGSQLRLTPQTLSLRVAGNNALLFRFPRGSDAMEYATYL